MKTSEEFHDFILYDVLGEVRGVTSKRMFSGYGLYQDGVIFAIIAEGSVYFRTDERTRPEYERRGSAPFQYKRKEKIATLKNYWQLPEEIMEDRGTVGEWVFNAVRASRERKSGR